MRFCYPENVQFDACFILNISNRMIPKIIIFEIPCNTPSDMILEVENSCIDMLIYSNFVTYNVLSRHTIESRDAQEND